MEVLQNFIFPENEVFGSQEKYFRTSGDVRVTESTLQMTDSSSALFDTYYNAFSIPLWLSKVGLASASLWLSGKGEVTVDLCQFTEAGEEALETRYFALSEESQLLFELPLNQLSGLLYPRIRARGEVEIFSMSWRTSEEVRRSVRLGISITTFNRKEDVVPAIQRIKQGLLDDGGWSDKIMLTVVDNASNLTAEEAQGAEVIPNENTGGSGGFMRGFLHYKNETDATHVLFMDDDAVLEMESIKRAYQILQFAVADNTAVGAALFYEEMPDKFISWGEYLGKFWVKVDFVNESALSPETVLSGEKNWLAVQPESAYMGWWFAAFPIQAIQRLTPPFFVRGDDMIFGQVNRLNVVYANGIASYAEDFQKKLTPLSTYLDQRNILLFYAFRSPKVFSLVFYYAALHITSLLTARYEYSQLYRMALEDFLQMTPESLVASAHISSKLPQINSIIQTEILRETAPIELAKFDRKFENTLISLLRVVFKPLKSKTVNQEFLMLPNWQNIAGYRNIQYYRVADHKAFTVRVSRWKLFVGLLGVVGGSFRLLFGFGRVRRSLLRKFDYLTSEEMWQEIFSGGDNGKSTD